MLATGGLSVPKTGSEGAGLRFARALGFDNFFDLKVEKTERLTTSALMHILDDFVRRTDHAADRGTAAS